MQVRMPGAKRIFDGSILLCRAKRYGGRAFLEKSCGFFLTIGRDEAILSQLFYGMWRTESRNPEMHTSDLTAMAEEMRRHLCGEAPFPAWPEAVRSSCFADPGKAVFLMVCCGAGFRLLSVARFAKDLPENFPGERVKLARCGGAVFSETDRRTAGALRSLLGLPAPGCLKEDGAEAVLLCRSGVVCCTAEAVQTVEMAELTPCWFGGSADDAFWSAFAAGWRQPFFWCRSLAGTVPEGEDAAALSARYGGRTFVLKDGDVLTLPDRIGFGLDAAGCGCEAAEVSSPGELLILAREAVVNGGRLGLAVIGNGGSGSEKLCRAVAASYGAGRVAVSRERWGLLRESGDRTAGLDLREYSFAKAAEIIKKMVEKTVK